MSQPTEKPDFTALVNSLIAKTKEGKVDWAPTATRTAFVASVEAKVGFKIFTVTSMQIGEFGDPEEMEIVRMQMLDEKSNVLWDVYSQDLKGVSLWDLYALARRIGNKVDTRISDALKALENL